MCIDDVASLGSFESLVKFKSIMSLERLIFSYSDSNTISFINYNLPKNQWYHIAVTTSGSFSALYINGEQIGSLVTPTSISSVDWDRITTSSLKIGADPHGNPAFPIDYFKGKLDDIRIYNRALTSQEIKAIYVFEK